MVNGDPPQMQQVVMNLVVNGMEAMKDLAGAREMVIDSQFSPEDQVLVTIRDNGPGIPEDLIEHIFDPFFTTKPRGTGMGLSISRTIVELHGGTLRVESMVGTGTTFFLTLPEASASR